MIGIMARTAFHSDNSLCQAQSSHEIFPAWTAARNSFFAKGPDYFAVLGNVNRVFQTLCILARLISLCRCGVEIQSGSIGSRVKHWQISLVILAALSASIALAEDFKTISGKEYKNAKVTRVEPDGIIVKTKSGISKLYWRATQRSSGALPL